MASWLLTESTSFRRAAMARSSNESATLGRVFYVRAHPDFVTSSDVFAMARSSFAWLVTGPEPVSVDGREIDGLPPRLFPLDKLGTVLLDPACPQQTRDGVWAYLITRSRAEGGTWTVACVGLALPMLLRVAALVTRRFSGDTHDLNAAVLTGFLHGLREVDLVRPAILARLYWAVYREGLAALHEAAGSPTPVADLELRTAPAPRPEGHPDLVLAAAVAAGVITADEAGLIAETRLGELSLTQAAHARGRSYKATQKFRERAEARLAAHLSSPAGDGPAPARSRRSGRVTPTRPSLLSVTATGASSERKVRRPVSPEDPESGIAARGIPQPARRRTCASRSAIGPTAHTVREVRSCD
ncbi:sigma-70 family RNA polymerase sigma factor [Amycolatopsis sp. WQ 127309]|uniref:sigma-70 family RNA polymerase sigma factor n=1 Tax=Amycolatopsis sp. WQ 127309 TaxID=2932773 RepID=UPI001FF6514D|nr:sigma-70 family RNA polymerase sigma factor [Amycolatopsis sp. WQ 127309]UOZ03423.1 sigma-70 family RNA polymerase sigma factor [Amycolatopsis sp. WQ 127309]